MARTTLKAQHVLRVAGDVRIEGQGSKRVPKGTRVIVVNTDGEFVTVRDNELTFRARGRVGAFLPAIRGRPRKDATPTE